MVAGPHQTLFLESFQVLETCDSAPSSRSLSSCLGDLALELIHSHLCSTSWVVNFCGCEIGSYLYLWAFRLILRMKLIDSYVSLVGSLPLK